MKDIFSLPIVKRKMIVVWGALLFGAIDLWYTSTSMAPEEFTAPFAWAVMLHYLALGMLVFMGGVFSHHPVFGFRIAPWWRGPVLSLVITFYSATGALMNPIQHMGKWEVFWWIVISGAIIAMILDVCGTKWGGEGEELLKKMQRGQATE